MEFNFNPFEAVAHSFQRQQKARYDAIPFLTSSMETLSLNEYTTSTSVFAEMENYGLQVKSGVGQQCFSQCVLGPQPSSTMLSAYPQQWMSSQEFGGFYNPSSASVGENLDVAASSKFKTLTPLQLQLQQLALSHDPPAAQVVSYQASPMRPHCSSPSWGYSPVYQEYPGRMMYLAAGVSPDGRYVVQTFETSPSRPDSICPMGTSVVANLEKPQAMVIKSKPHHHECPKFEGKRGGGKSMKTEAPIVCCPPSFANGVYKKEKETMGQSSKMVVEIQQQSGGHASRRRHGRSNGMRKSESNKVSSAADIRRLLGKRTRSVSASDASLHRQEKTARTCENESDAMDTSAAATSEDEITKTENVDKSDGRELDYFCKFCRSNKETVMFYRSHMLTDEKGIVQCPILRSHVCPICNATGDNAHTTKYCPLQPKPVIEPIPAAEMEDQSCEKRTLNYITTRTAVGGYCISKF